MWFKLRGPKGEENWQGRIRLSLRWIHSKVALLEKLMLQWEDTVKADYLEKKNIEDHLEKLIGRVHNLILRPIYLFE